MTATKARAKIALPSLALCDIWYKMNLNGRVGANVTMLGCYGCRLTVSGKNVNSVRFSPGVSGQVFQVISTYS